MTPRALGGTDSPQNLVLLCSRCHKEAPNVADPSFMWLWLRRYAVTFYDTAWISRGYEEFEKIFKRKPHPGLDQLPPSKVREALTKRYNMIITHFGEGKPNPSTVAWVLAEIEKDFAAELAKLE